MKKLTAFLLLVSLLVALAACDNGKRGDSAAASEPTLSFGDRSDDSQALSGDTGDRSDVSQAPSGDMETGILGRYTESTRTYVNGVAGIGCKLPAGWEVFDEEQLARLSGLVIDKVDDEAIADLLRNGSNVSVFYAQKNGGRSTINIGIEELNAQVGADEQQYVAQAIDLVAPMLESMGMENVTTRAGTISFAGREHAAIFIKAYVQGVALYETQVCMITGNYMAVITVGCSATDNTRDTLSLFFAL